VLHSSIFHDDPTRICEQFDLNSASIFYIEDRTMEFYKERSIIGPVSADRYSHDSQYFMIRRMWSALLGGLMS